MTGGIVRSSCRSRSDLDVRRSDVMPESAQDRMDAAAEAVREWTAENERVGGVCDFCSRILAKTGLAATYVTSSSIVSTMVQVVIDGSDQQDVGELTQVQDPFWAACPACDTAIRERWGDAAALAEYVWTHRDKVRVPSTTLVEDTIHRGYLRRLYVEFFARDPVRVQEGEGDV